MRMPGNMVSPAGGCQPARHATGACRRSRRPPVPAREGERAAATTARAARSGRPHIPDRSLGGPAPAFSGSRRSRHRTPAAGKNAPLDRINIAAGPGRADRMPLMVRGSGMEMVGIDASGQRRSRRRICRQARARRSRRGAWPGAGPCSATSAVGAARGRRRPARSRSRPRLCPERRRRRRDGAAAGLLASSTAGGFRGERGPAANRCWSTSNGSAHR